MLTNKVNQLFEQQVQEWDLAVKNYTGLNSAKKKTFAVNGEMTLHVQFNPERIYSSSAKVDPKSIQERKCFLCQENLPPQQRWVDFNHEYLVLVNPFPIFPRHLTIPHRNHTDQLIKGRMEDMLTLAKELPDFEIFYNGPRCGASAPDHFHFQAGNKGFMPILNEYRNASRTLVKGLDSCRVFTLDNFLRKCIVLQGPDLKILTTWFDQICQAMEQIIPNQPPEPMMNILAAWHENRWLIFIFPRKLHRPWQYFEEGDKQILLSPASVDLGGVLITPREEDFLKISISDITDIFDQITWSDSDFLKLIKMIANQ